MSEFNQPPQPSRGGDELPEESLAAAEPEEKITVSPVGKRKKIKEKKPKKKRPMPLRVLYWFIGVLSLAVLAYGGLYAYVIYKAENNIRTSHVLPAYHGKVMDLLLMGLDTRKDENGNNLSNEVYNALHAGDGSTGGNNSNVLMYIHISADGRATAISIPRDDWVPIANCETDYALRQYVPSGCSDKIKEAYGLRFSLTQSQCGTSQACYQKAKDAARLEEIQTVENFLDVKITSFVEVTMGAFYEIAQQVQPITVCVKEQTIDSFSGANFKRGSQQVNAKQAVAFVRQRRDLHNRYSFTDLDRSRRQQAFIVSLLTKLKSAGTLLDPLTLNSIVDVASNNVVKSDGLDPLSLAKLASTLGGNNLHLYTLPIVTDNYWPSGTPGVGKVANQVNTTEIRAIVKSLINTGSVNLPKPSKTPSKPKSTPLPSGAGYTVNAVNASLVNHGASKLLAKLTQFKYTTGTAKNAPALSTGSTITFNPADQAAAAALAQRLNSPVTLIKSSAAASHVLTLVIGSTLANTPKQIRKTATTSAPTAHRPSNVPTAVSATGGGTN
ncbi:MAG TPA: LCP family protein, partial [Marmoricola sp.]|nr:LCP family protein [Marmoricola sp.]